MAKETERAEEARVENMIDLNGEFRFKVDDKGRVSLPAVFRKTLSKQVVVARDFKEEYLRVFEKEAYAQFLDEIFERRFGGFNPANSEHVKLYRAARAKSADVEIDSAGRISLSQALRDEVGIEKDVVIVGNRGYFEIWDAKRYDEMSAEVDLSQLYF